MVPIVNVRTGPLLWACIIDTTSAESMPPERNAPSGTSERMRIRVASSRSSCTASTAAPSSLGSVVVAVASSTDQYARGMESPGAALTATTSKIDAGGSLETPVKIERGAGTQLNRK